MNKLKAWFKKTFTPVDNYEDIRLQMAMVLEVSDIIDSDNPDYKRLCQLLSQITLIDFVWVDDLWTPMELACFKGNPWCVAALIANGADVHGTERNKKGVSDRPIHLACMSKNKPRNLDCVRMLMEKGADCRLPDHTGSVPIQLAALSGDVKVVEHLLNMGVPVDSTGPNNKKTPLGSATTMPLTGYHQQSGGEGDVVSQRQEDGEQTQAGSQDFTTTQAQAQAGSAPGSKAGERDCSLKDRMTPKARIHRLMRLLLEHGADVNLVMEQLTDCLTMAASYLYVDRILILLAYGADVNNPRRAEHQCILKAVLETVPEKTVQTDNIITTLSLLLAAGAKISLESLENGIYPVLESRSELASVKEVVYQLLHRFAAASLPLKTVCRMRIRALLPPDIDASTRRLPVPDLLQSYLRFEDIVPREAEDF